MRPIRHSSSVAAAQYNAQTIIIDFVMMHIKIKGMGEMVSYTLNGLAGRFTLLIRLLLVVAGLFFFAAQGAFAASFGIQGMADFGDQGISAYTVTLDGQIVVRPINGTYDGCHPSGIANANQWNYCTSNSFQFLNVDNTRAHTVTFAITRSTSYVSTLHSVCAGNITCHPIDSKNIKPGGSVELGATVTIPAGTTGFVDLRFYPLKPPTCELIMHNYASGNQSLDIPIKNRFGVEWKTARGADKIRINPIWSGVVDCGLYSNNQFDSRYTAPYSCAKAEMGYGGAPYTLEQAKGTWDNLFLREHGSASVTITPYRSFDNKTGAACTITIVSSKPDLEVTNHWVVRSSDIYDMNIQSGDAVLLNAIISNRGKENAGVTKTRFCLDLDSTSGAMTCDREANIDTVAIQGKTQVSYSWSPSWVATPGTHRYQICADHSGLVDESNETNNCKTGSFTVITTSTPQPTSVKIQGLLYEKTTTHPRVAGTVTLSGGGSVTTRIDNQTYSGCSIKANGACMNGSFVWSNLLPGQRTVTLTLPSGFASPEWSVCYDAVGACHDTTVWTAGTTATINASYNSYADVWFRLTPSSTDVGGGNDAITVPGTGSSQDNNTTNNAECMSITSPGSVEAGSTFIASVQMKNIGTKSWGSSTHYLGPLDSSISPWSSVWSPFRVSLPSQGVSMGDNSVTFNFSVTAPQSAGVYRDYGWKMLETGVEWFGEACTKSITVTESSPVDPGPNADFIITHNPHVPPQNSLHTPHTLRDIQAIGDVMPTTETELAVVPSDGFSDDVTLRLSGVAQDTSCDGTADGQFLNPNNFLVPIFGAGAGASTKTLTSSKYNVKFKMYVSRGTQPGCYIARVTGTPVPEGDARYTDILVVVGEGTPGYVRPQ